MRAANLRVADALRQTGLRLVSEEAPIEKVTPARPTAMKTVVPEALVARLAASAPMLTGWSGPLVYRRTKARACLAVAYRCRVRKAPREYAHTLCSGSVAD